MRAHAIGVATVLATLLWTASPASAQQRPLVTEDPETIGAGRILLEVGLDTERGTQFPLSGLGGNLFSFPNFGVSIGLGSIVELQVDGGLYQRLNITEREPAPYSDLLDVSGDQSSTVRDTIIATKFRVAGETASRPAFGFRLATRLPSASARSGLGRDTLDFTSQFLIAKTIESIRVVGNVGFLILPDPTMGTRHDGLLVYGFSLARAIAEGFEVVGELNGRSNFDDDVPVGAEDAGFFRFGARYTRGPVRVDGGILIGITPRDPSFGFTTGVTWVFNAFRVP